MGSFDALLVVFIALKLVCLFFCIKMISWARKGNSNHEGSEGELNQLNSKIEQIKKQNQLLQEEIKKSKNI